MENTWWLSKATEIQNYADANMAHQFYEAKAIYGPKSHSTHPARANDGITLIKDKKDILSCWAEHLQELLNQDNPVDQSTADQLPQLPIISELDTIPSIEEISAAANNIRHLALIAYLLKFSNTGAICCYSDSTLSLAMRGHRIFFPHNGKVLI